MQPVTRQTYQLFWHHARRYRALVTVMVIALVMAVVLETIIPLSYKRFFDILSTGDHQGATAGVLVGILFNILWLNIITWGLWRVAVFGNNFLQPRVMADLANSCFAYLHGHSYGFFISRFVGSLVRKVNRLVDSFENVSDRVYWELGPLAVRIIAILLVLGARSPALAGILLGWTVLYLGINYVFTLYKLRFEEQRAAADTAVTARLADSITNNANIKLFTAHGHEQTEFGKLTERQRAITRFTWDLDGLMWALQSLLMLALEFSMFYIAVRWWRRGQLTIGDFVLIQTYLLQLLHRLWDFGRIIRDLYKGLANAQEMVEVLNMPHDVQNKPVATPLRVSRGALDFRQVRFDYSSTRQIIKGFDLSIAPGEKVGLVGPSGAGKTTLVALLFRFYDVTDGRILIDGQNIADVTQESLRSQISFVPQDPILFHRTLLENIRYGNRDATIEQVKAAASAAHCDEFISQLPAGYDTYVGERGVKLSGGERQRVAIARAILKNAPILVLDEATSSLDSHAEQLIQQALAKLMEGKTTIVIAHRLSTINKMNRIVVVRDGAIHEVGTHAELVKTSGGLYRQLWELQAGGFIV
ncbi:MAG: putative ABC multidrug transport system, fused ATPase and permease domain [Parcubacteria group bacterium Gr01-1014_31]|nr:MAG: putative ABC multidrug transport system, fused ATPase and permease domain [Parcubacteria group bacterium Gr01-1014_31]